MSFDQVVAVVGLTIAGIGVIAGTVAAIFAIRADSSTRRASALADVRWEQEIRPRPQVSGLRSLSADSPVIMPEVANVGGAAVDCMIVVRVRDQAYYVRLARPEHAINEVFTFTRVGQLDSRTGRSMNETSEILCTLAEDIEGRWWDCLAGIRAPRAFPGESTEFLDWANGRLAAARLSENLAVVRTTGGLVVERP